MTEEASNLLVHTYTDWLILAKVATAPRGRIIRNVGILPIQDSPTLRMQGTFVRLMSITEAYVDTVLAAELTGQVPLPNTLVRRLLDDRIEDASRGWNDRKDLGILVGVRVTDFPAWSRVDTAIDVRNAIAHGLGRLTRLQTKDGKVATALRQHGVQIDGRDLRLSAKNITDCKELCLGFVKWLDGRLTF